MTRLADVVAAFLAGEARQGRLGAGWGTLSEVRALYAAQLRRRAPGV